MSATFSQRKRDEVWGKLDGHCAYCGITIGRDDFDIDHAEPLLSGGGDEIDNLMPSCKSCNRSKRARNAEEWKRHLIDKIADRMRRAGQELFDSKFIDGNKNDVLDPLLVAYNNMLKSSVTFYFETVDDDA